MRYAVRRKDTGEFNGSSVIKAFWTHDMDEVRVYRRRTDADVSIRYLARSCPPHTFKLDMEVVEFTMIETGNTWDVRSETAKKRR